MSNIEAIRMLNGIKQDIVQRTHMLKVMHVGDYIKNKMDKQGHEECEALDAAILALSRAEPDIGITITENAPLTLDEAATAIRIVCCNNGCPPDTDCFDGQNCHECYKRFISYRRKPEGV